MQPLGICFQVNEDGTFRRHIARGRIVFEIAARDPVEAARILPIDHDLDVMQFGPAAFFELDRL